MAEPSPYRIPAPPMQGELRDGTRERRMAYRLLRWGVASVLGSLVAQVFVPFPLLLAVGTLGGMVLALAGVVWALVGLVRAARSDANHRAGRIARSFGAFVANGALFAFGVLAAYLSTLAFRRGRQIRRRGKVLLPPVVRRTAWAALPLPQRVIVDEEMRRPLAAAWRENGRTEHASVAAFAKLTLDLMALGAPPLLVAAAQRDALDEIRHAELCFSLARALDGDADGPGPFLALREERRSQRVRVLALAGLAVDSLIDGALHEGVSARVLSKLGLRCEVPAIQAVLKELAADEGRHSAHGWDVVAWCLSEGGAPIAEALFGALAGLPKTMRTTLPEPAREGLWERYGIHGHLLENAMHAQARADVVMRVHRLVTRSELAA